MLPSCLFYEYTKNKAYLKIIKCVISDLAKLYGCKNGTKDINKAVKRNLNRFPEDFYFQLSDSELKQGQY